MAIGHSSSGRRIFIIGAHHPSPHLLPLDRSSFTEGDLNTVVAVGAEAKDPLQAFAAAYFKIVRVLDTFDSDRDLIISSQEIAAAPTTLRTLDRDHDGKLSPEECGFSLGSDSERLDPQFVRNARLEFMRGNPALAALDSDSSGEISEAEISNSAAALRTLDKNGDKSLSPREVLPDRTANQARLILSRLDLNGDGRISAAERASAGERQLRDLLEHADRNHDGATTPDELTEELQLREEQWRQFENGSRVAGWPPSNRKQTR